MIIVTAMVYSAIVFAALRVGATKPLSAALREHPFSFIRAVRSNSNPAKRLLGTRGGSDHGAEDAKFVQGLPDAGRSQEDGAHTEISAVQKHSHGTSPSFRNAEEDAVRHTVSEEGAANIPFGSTEAMNKVSSEERLASSYSNQFQCFRLPKYPNCQFYLCGTLHVSQWSTDMVRDVIRTLRPQVVMLELCPNRLDSLILEESAPTPVTLREVLQASWQERSLLSFGVGLLTWMQSKAAALLNSQLGGELVAAAREAQQTRSSIVLGDRLYDVTIQRMFDKMSWMEKMHAGVLMVWEVVTMSVGRMKDYVAKTQTDASFVQSEIASLTRHFPSLAEVVVTERDVYLAQTLLEVARSCSRPLSPSLLTRTGEVKIVAVVGTAHLPGIRKSLESDGVSLESINQISTSSRHGVTWPGPGAFFLVNADDLRRKQK